MKKNVKRIAELTARVVEQQKWIETCGGTLTAYVTKYAEPDDPYRGERIWQADTKELERLEYQLQLENRFGLKEFKED